MARARRYIEDPSVAWAAKSEFDRIWAEIDRMTGQGEWMFRAREVVLAREYPFMAKAYGKAVADRVTRAIQMQDYSDLSAATIRAIRDRAVPGSPPKAQRSWAPWSVLAGALLIAFLLVTMR